MSSNIECITLDDSEDEGAGGVPGVKPLDSVPGHSQSRTVRNTVDSKRMRYPPDNAA